MPLGTCSEKRIPLKGLLEELLLGFYIRALIIRIGVWGFFIIIIV